MKEGNHEQQENGGGCLESEEVTKNNCRVLEYLGHVEGEVVHRRGGKNDGA